MSCEKYKLKKCCVRKLFFLFLFWHSKQYLYTTCCQLVFFLEFNEQSLVILWVNWCKNEGFWKRFTCIRYRKVIINSSCFKLSSIWILKKNSRSSLLKKKIIWKKNLFFKHLVRLQNQRIGQSRSINRIKAVPLTPWWWHGPRKKLPYTRLLHSGSKS